MPLFYTPNINLTDINRHLKLEFLTRNKLNIEHCNQWYKNINKDNSSIDNYCRSFHRKSSRLDQIKIIRLRLGHTKLTHDILHLLNSCPSLLPTKLSNFKNTNPINLPNELNPDNLEKILLFLKASNLYHKI